MYRFRCSFDNSIHEIHLTIKDYKSEMECPCGKGVLNRVYDNFNAKNGRTVQQKNIGATEKRLEGGKWTKNETEKRKKNAPPDSRESKSNEYWLGNEFKNGERSLKDF